MRRGRKKRRGRTRGERRRKKDFTVDITDSGSNVITRPYVALGYVAQTEVNVAGGLVGGHD